MTKIEVLEQMLKTDPDNANVWYLLGMEYSEINVNDKALQAFSKALINSNDELRIKIAEKIAEISTLKSINPDPVYIAEDSNGEKIKNTTGGAVTQIQKFAVIEGKKPETNIVNIKSKKSKITFDDVAGLDELKDTIRMKIIKPFVNPELFSRFQKKSGGGILLYGPPGCGKTFIAKATSGECNANFVSVHITDILDPYIGVSERNIYNIFATARNQAPSILFLDEMDALGYHRGKLRGEHHRAMIDQLLAEMEGIDTNTEKILVIGATNMPWDIDPAFKRPGRFDKMVFVPPPDKPARSVLFSLKLEGKPVSNDINFDLLAAKTEFYSGADIENVVETATESVIHDIMNSGTERPITMKDLIEAIDNTMPSTLDWLRTIKSYVKYANQSGQFNDVAKYLNEHKQI